jgi:hypothetical protein
MKETLKNIDITETNLYDTEEGNFIFVEMVTDKGKEFWTSLSKN